MAIRSTGFALLKSNEGCHRYALAIAWQVSKANFLLASQRSSPLGGVPSSQRSTWLVPPQPPAFPRRWRPFTSHKPLLSSFRVIASFHGFVSWSPNHSKKTWREFSRRRSRPSHRRDERALARRTGGSIGARTPCPRLRGRCAKEANRDAREGTKERTRCLRCSGRS